MRIGVLSVSCLCLAGCLAGQLCFVCVCVFCCLFGPLGGISRMLISTVDD